MQRKESLDSIRPSRNVELTFRNAVQNECIGNILKYASLNVKNLLIIKTLIRKSGICG